MFRGYYSTPLEVPMPIDPALVASRAAELFSSGNNCAQAVAAALLETMGADPVPALAGLAPFGAGICYRQLTCGAVSGALYALGMVAWRPGDNSAAYVVGKQFCSRFEKELGALSCRELLGADITTESGLAAVRAAGLFTTRCPELVRAAAVLAGELGGELS